jgi:hypothetical protein
MSSHDGIIELNREIACLESALAAEREKVVGLADRVRGLEAFIDKVFVHWSFDNDQQHTHTWHTREDLRAEYAALTPPAPAKENTDAVP